MEPSSLAASRFPFHSFVDPSSFSRGSLPGSPCSIVIALELDWLTTLATIRGRIGGRSLETKSTCKVKRDAILFRLMPLAFVETIKLRFCEVYACTL